MAAKAATAAKAAPAETKGKPAPKAAKPKAASAPGAKRVNAITSRMLTPSPALAAVVGGAQPIPRTEAVSKVWEYIRRHGLQNPENKREILGDEKLKAVLGQDKATMFELSGLLSKHLS